MLNACKLLERPRSLDQRRGPTAAEAAMLRVRLTLLRAPYDLSIKLLSLINSLNIFIYEGLARQNMVLTGTSHQPLLLLPFSPLPHK